MRRRRGGRRWCLGSARRVTPGHLGRRVQPSCESARPHAAITRTMQSARVSIAGSWQSASRHFGLLDLDSSTQCDAGQVGRPEGRRLHDLWHHYRDPQHVGLELHQQAVATAPPSHTQRSMRGRHRLLGAHHVHGLVGDRLQRRSYQVLAPRAPGQPDYRTAGVHVPVRSAVR